MAAGDFFSPQLDQKIDLRHPLTGPAAWDGIRTDRSGAGALVFPQESGWTSDGQY